MLNFKIRKLENFKFSYDELLAYYETVTADFQNLKWHVPNLPLECGHSWAIQTKMLNPEEPCPPYNMPGDTSTEYNNYFDTPTALVFGFAKKILEQFPYAKQTVITVHGAGSSIEFHIDKEHWLPEEQVKIHIPITANDQSYFQFEDEDFVMEPGHAYLVNTTIPHGTVNHGSTPRAHLIFKIPVSRVAEILATDITL